jgi:aerobic C4-dicarboxylate transport protein
VPSLPVAGLALILGIDRFMSEARALTNMIGNGVATIVVARWEGELDFARLNRELAGGRTRVARLATSPDHAADQSAGG